jgi:cold shock protein
MPSGKIKMYSEERGFGFIGPDDGSSDVFFHVTALREGDDINVGAAVTFETGVDPKSGKIRAVSVDLAA